MDQMEYYLSNPPCLSVPVSDADKLLGCSNLLCMKLYLYLLRAGKSVTPERAAEDLNIPLADLKKAAKELKSMGLMSTAGKGKLPPEQKIPEYEKTYIVKRSMEDANFEGLQMEAANILGHTLSAQELNTLFGIYDHLGLPPEVICVLLTFCLEEVREKYGPGRVPTMRHIEQQAYIWAREEIMTLELADAYLGRRKERKDTLNQLKRMMGIWDRAFTKTELGYLNDWLDKGFGIDAIAIAFDRTVTQTNGVKWPYMNRIVQNWHDKGLHTPEEIEAGDKPLGKPAQKQTARPAAPAQGDELKRLKEIFGDISK